MWLIVGLIVAVITVFDAILMVSIRINRAPDEQVALDDEQAAILGKLNDGV